MAFPDPPPHPTAVEKNPELLKGVDERITLDKKSSLWVFEQDGVEHTFNFILQQWIPNDDNKRTLDDEEENKATIKRIKKEKLQAVRDEIQRLKAERTTQQTSGVYVSNLPQGITKEELLEVFSKFGIISEDYKTGEARVKLYYDDEGNFKHSALIIYHAKESVPVAIDMLNDTILSTSVKNYNVKIKVQPAEFGESEQGPKKTLSAEQKQLLNKRKEIMRQKLSDWDDSASDKSEYIKKKIWDKTVVVEQMFRLEELQQDPLLEMDLKEDIQEECEKFGIGNDITKVKIFDKSGVVTIKFTKQELAAKCITAFQGRYFDGLKLNVFAYDGKIYETSDDSK